MTHEWPFWLWAMLLAGLALRLGNNRMEVRHMRWAWDWLARTDAAKDHEDPMNAKRATILKRTYMALSAARLARIASLVFLVPASLLLMEQVWGSARDPQLELAVISLEVLLLFFVFTLANSLLMRSFYDKDRPSTRLQAPAWLANESERVPAPLAAGALLWDWLVRQGLALPLGRRMVRPGGRLFELEGEIVMAIGEGELGALDQRNATDVPGEKTELDMIRAIQRLDQTLVREVMRPLNDVTAISLSNFTAEKLLQLARRTGYTRIPAYHDQITNLVGYLNVHDFLEKAPASTDPRQMVHSCLFIPEVARVDLALREMLRARSQIAICFDEFGGCSGLLSREDIIEEITGEIRDEYDRPQRERIHRGAGYLLVDGSIDLDDLRETTGLDLEKKNCDTLAGYIYQRLSRTPKRGETLNERGWELEVAQMEKHRIRRVRLTPPGSAAVSREKVRRDVVEKESAG